MSYTIQTKKSNQNMSYTTQIIFHTQNRQSIIHNIDKLPYTTQTNFWVQFHIKQSESYLRCYGGLSYFYKRNVNQSVLMHGVCRNLCFSYREGDCLLLCCHCGDCSFCLVKKYTEMVSSKKYSQCRLVKIYTEIGQKHLFCQ